MLHVNSESPTSYLTARSLLMRYPRDVTANLAHYSVVCTLLTTYTLHNISTVLRALSSIGIFEQTGKEFRQSELSEHLRSDHPDSVRATSLLCGDEHYKVWGELLYALKTGKSAFEKVYGKDIFSYFMTTPPAFAIFNKSMNEISKTEAMSASFAKEALEGSRVLCDIGGGQGDLLFAFMHEFAHVEGVLFDLEGAVGGDAEVRIREKAGDELGKRLGVVAGDMFNSATIPQCDTYMMKHVIQDWSDEKCVEIISNVRKRCESGGKLLIVEFLVTPESLCNKWEDINMMLMAPGGMERTEEEFAELLEKGGFKLKKIYPTDTLLFVIEGIAQ